MAIWTIFKKELKETLRDRRTLMIMLGMPLLLIPIIVSITSKAVISQAETEREKDVRIALVDNGNGQEFVDMLSLRKDVRVHENIPPNEFRDLIRTDSLDVGIILASNFDEAIESGKTAEIEVFYNSTNEIPFERVSTTFDRFYDGVLSERLSELGVSTEIVTPVSISEIDAYTQRENLGKTIGGFLPYVFVIFCMMGAMYPSIDLFTGEKERGTLETILTSPANRLQILLGKMGTVVLAGVFSGGLAILGLYLAVKFNPEVPGFIQNIILQILSPAAVIQILLLLIPLTIFFAGALIPASIYARSFKEAQSLIQPMMIVVIIPLAVIAILPNLTLNATTAIIPIVNVGLASKEIIAGTMNTSMYLLVFGSLVVFAAIGISLCIRWFGKEGNILRV